jgi:nicotinate-nucleotide--dimethylbenzimidazole phosphoribosyltransferase
VRRGSGDILHEPAMTEAEARALMARGRALVAEEVKRGARLLVPGEMGIGNSTAAAAVAARLLGLPAEATVGRGTGLDDQGLAHKREVVAAALQRSTAPADDALSVLADLGGLEMAFLTGAILGAAEDRLPVLLDGFISSTAALVAARLEPRLTPFLLAAHVSAEPGHGHVLAALGLEPLLRLGMRLGEGSGAAIAYPLLLAATRLQAEMATFASASVTDPLADAEREEKPHA